MIRPTRWLPAWWRAAAFAVLALCGHGQEPERTAAAAPPLSARASLPDLPASGLLDEGQVFNEQDEVLVTADLEDFRHRTGVPLFLVAANYIHGEPAETYGERVMTAWAGGKPALLLLFERGSGKLIYSATPNALGPAAEMKEFFHIGRRAAAGMPPESTTAQMIRAAVQALTLAGESWKNSGKVPSAETPPARVPDKSPAPRESIPSPPVDYVFDEAGAFDLAEESALKTQLIKFHSKHNLDVYVLAWTTLPEGVTAQSRADQLAAAWLGDRSGAVIVMNRGTAEHEDRLGFAGASEDEQRITSAVLGEAFIRARARADEIWDSPQGSPAKALRGAADAVMETFLRRGSVVYSGNATSRPGRLFAVIAATLVAGTFLLFLFHRIQERLENRSNEQFLFPDVRVDRRLDSPYGGGNVAGIKFGGGQQ